MERKKSHVKEKERIMMYKHYMSFDILRKEKRNIQIIKCDKKMQ